MTTNSEQHAASLTKNQKLVFDVLAKSAGPLSAYTILDQLRDHGMRAPLQIYRALDKLLETGMVHRLESINAFVACSHGECEASDAAAFAICEKCEKVMEISSEELASHLQSLVANSGFRIGKSTIELRGCCKSCGASGDKSNKTQTDKAL